MANYFVTKTAQFKPFSYQEMLAPIKAYQDAYNALENEMVNLDIMVEDVGNKLTEKDTALKNIYKTYKEDLNNALNGFYQNGYTSDSKKKLAQLKSRYSKEINPINEAYKSYQEDQKQLITLKRTHPEMIIEGIGNSVSDYMHGNTPNGITANTEDIYNKSMKAAAGTSNRFSELLEPTGILGNQYYQFKTQQGISQDMVEKLRSIIDNPTSTDSKKFLSTDEGKALYNIISEQRKANNYDNFSKKGKNRIDASILNGIFAGVSFKEDVDRVSNKNWKSPTDTSSNPPTNNISTLNTFTLGSKTDKTLVKQSEKDIEFLKNLKQITDASGKTITTNNELFTLEKEINDLRQRWSNAQIDGTSNSNRSKIENELNSKIRTYNSKKEKFNKELSALSDKYSYLNFDNEYLNISIGSMYENARSQEEVFIGDLQYRPEDEKKLDESVTKDFEGISGGNVGLFNPGETKALSTKDANTLLEGAHVIVKSDEGIVLKTSDGIKHIKGSDNVDAFNRSYKATSNFLKDYTSEGLKTSTIIQGNIEDISNLTYKDITSLNNNNLVSVVSNESGDTFYGMIVKDSSTNNIYKVLLHPSGYKAVSSLNDIINYGGPSIRKYEEMMLNRGLEHYFNINTRKP